MTTFLEDQAIMNLLHLGSEEDQDPLPTYCRSKTLHATQLTKPLHQKPLVKNSSLIQRNRTTNTQHKMRVQSEPQSLSVTLHTSSNKQNLKKILEKLNHSPRKAKTKGQGHDIIKKTSKSEKLQPKRLKTSLRGRSEASVSTMRTRVTSKRKEELMEKVLKKVVFEASNPSRGRPSNIRGLSNGQRRSREMVSYNKMLRDQREVNSKGIMGRCSPVDLKQLLF